MKQRIDIIVIGSVDHEEVGSQREYEKAIRLAVSNALEEIPGVEFDDLEIEYGGPV